jgi:long-chain acyl-CoA synthetase
MITNRALLAGALTMMLRVQEIEEPRYFSYLPAAHVYERVINIGFIYNGWTCVYYSGSIKNLSADMQAGRPNLLPSVPRLWAKIKAGVDEKISEASPLTRALFRRAYNAQLKHTAKHNGARSAFWDRLVFSKIQGMVGGALRYTCSGAAPLDPRTGEFLYVVFNLRVVEGYGLTESGAALVGGKWQDSDAFAAGYWRDEHLFGMCPMGDWQVRLVDVPELGYTASGPQPTGECLIKGSALFSGYWNDAEATAECMTEEGYFRTGDVARVIDGRVYIVDRIKSTIKLAQGEHVPLAQIENSLQDAKFIASLCATGVSTATHLVAAVVPDFARLRKALKTGPEVSNYDIICMPAAQDAILASLDQAASVATLRSFERLRHIVFDPVEWTVESGLVTATQKPRRGNVKAYYCNYFDALYAGEGTEGVRAVTKGRHTFCTMVDDRATRALAVKGPAMD